jgi:hypothetical protein
LLAEKFSVAQIATARQPDEPYLKWVESAAMSPGTAGALRVSIDRKLENYAGDKEKPDHTDQPRDYLAKASRAYLDDCIRFHHQRNEGGYDPLGGIGSWLQSAGRVWTINDSLTQTLTVAQHHGYSHASAELDGRPRRDEYDMQRLADVNIRPNSPHR